MSRQTFRSLSQLVIHSPLARYATLDVINLRLTQCDTTFGTWLHYKHIWPMCHSLTYVTGNFSYVFERMCKSTTLVDLHILSFFLVTRDDWQGLYVLAHRINLVAWCSNHLALKPFWHSQIISQLNKQVECEDVFLQVYECPQKWGKRMMP